MTSLVASGNAFAILNWPACRIVNRGENPFFFPFTTVAKTQLSLFPSAETVQCNVGLAIAHTPVLVQLAAFVQFDNSREGTNLWIS